MKSHPILQLIITGVVTALITFIVTYFFIYAPSDIAVLKSEINQIKTNQQKLNRSISELDKKLYDFLLLIAKQNGVNARAIDSNTSVQRYDMDKNELITNLLLLDNTSERKKYLGELGFSKTEINDILNNQTKN